MVLPGAGAVHVTTGAGIVAIVDNNAFKPVDLFVNENFATGGLPGIPLPVGPPLPGPPPLVGARVGVEMSATSKSSSVGGAPGSADVVSEPALDPGDNDEPPSDPPRAPLLVLGSPPLPDDPPLDVDELSVGSRVSLFIVNASLSACFIIIPLLLLLMLLLHS